MTMKVQVGINYPCPWNKYGVYFGSGETAPGDNPKYSVWPDNLERNLIILKKYGVKIVRIFLFGNAWNLGKVIPSNDPSYHWQFVLPETLHKNYLEEFERMLTAFDNTGLRVIPSLLDFTALAKWDAYPSGRGDLFTDDDKFDSFVERVYRPLLEVSSKHEQSIFAWEMVNEPSQVMQSWAHFFLSLIGKKRSDHPIPKDVMARRLDQLLIEAVCCGFNTTVGHWKESDCHHLPTGTCPQFHYYPTRWLGIIQSQRLPGYSDPAGSFIGEFAADFYPKDQSWGMHWPELSEPVQCDAKLRTFKRLNLIESKGYKTALLWPDKETYFDPKNPESDPLKFSLPVLEGIKSYLES
jgi:hypothetical protein